MISKYDLVTIVEYTNDYICLHKYGWKRLKHNLRNRKEGIMIVKIRAIRNTKRIHKIKLGFSFQ